MQSDARYLFTDGNANSDEKCLCCTSSAGSFRMSSESSARNGENGENFLS